MQRSSGSAGRPANHWADNSSAAQPADRSSDADKNFFHYSRRELPEVVHEILFNLPPQCLLKLSAASQALHHHATCDDVCRVAMYGSLLPDSFAFSSRRPDA